MTPTIVIAGVSSGVGKTTVATGLMAAFSQRGLRVQGFKVGPDYIDPSYHTAVTGRPSRTLDGWMLGLDHVAELFDRASEPADLCIIEGVMGLFDGRTGGHGAGSTAEIAALLGAPVLLVVDAWAIARSAAAIVHGYRTFDPKVTLAGVVLNRIAGPGHYDAVAPPIEEEAGVPVLGSLGRDDGLSLPERYLGLIPVTEGPIATGYFETLISRISSAIDLERILKIAATARPPVAPTRELFPTEEQPRRTRIAIAQDQAFSFYYADSLDLLQAWGVELVPFSPLADPALPDNISGVYLGGGFPELFASDLAANRPIRTALREAVASGITLYAECGGYMYAGRSLVDATGTSHEMVGVLPLESRLDRSRLTLGYREVTPLNGGPIASRNSTIRGHEFHWSVSEPLPARQAAYSVHADRGQPEWTEGSVAGSAWGSYVHLHFGSDRHLAPHFVKHCALPSEAKVQNGSKGQLNR